MAGRARHSIPQAGAVVGGKYEVLRLIGEGGMGAVFEAEHRVTKRRFALKWMQPELAEGPEAVMRFTQEARTSCAIEHPNIVDVFDIDSDDGSLYIVMELLKGETLADRIDRGAVDAKELVPILASALHGLHVAHQRGIVHRDLKPENIFLKTVARQPPVAKILDFGISKMGAGNSQSGMRITQTGVMMGTAAYMAPEQTRDAASVDFRADLYSFAALLYETFAGRPPFESDNFAGLVLKIVTEEAPPLHTLNASLPLAFSRVIMRNLSKDPSRRSESALAFADALEATLTHEPFEDAATAASVQTVPARPAARPAQDTVEPGFDAPPPPTR
ncbi:MAG: serine/threonine-protein kinase, partial [Myxococcota bacterium]